MRIANFARLLTFASVVVIGSLSPLHAQQTVGQPPFTPWKDKPLLMQQLPKGAPVAIMEIEDLECPACAHAYPIVHAALTKYKIPLVRYDFIIPGHVWSRTAAITARYLEDKVSPTLAAQFRGDVFANQQSILTADDLQNFTRSWFQKHNQPMPFVMDPTGRFTAEIESDVNKANRLGLIHTPTLVVLTPHGWTEVTDVSQLYSVIDRALAESSTAAPVAKGGPKKPAGGLQN
jgi:protein-disulfide isomerase